MTEISDTERAIELARSTRRYLTGFVVAMLLTSASFAVVITGMASPAVALGALACLAVVQIAVHLRYFLDLDFSTSRREDLQLILFTVLLGIVMLGGTFWIMGSLAARMMPAMP